MSTALVGDATVDVALPQDCEPPFDDEYLPGGRLSETTGGTADERRYGPDAGRQSGDLRLLRLEGAPASVPGPGPAPSPAPGPARVSIPVPAPRTPPASRDAWDVVAGSLARALLECLAGRRPLNQLRHHCTPDAFESLQDQPALPGPDLPVLRSLRVGRPRKRAAEISAVFIYRRRARAMALRVEEADNCWQVTAARVG